MPVSALHAAAAESTALHYYDQAPSKQGHADEREKEFLIDSISELSSEDRRHVAALVESLRHEASLGNSDEER